MSDPPTTVTVRVPASTSNCGPGFDTLGLALALYNRVRLARTAGAAIIPARAADGAAQAMAEAAAAVFRRATDRPAFGFSYRIEGDVPAARGLGSSVTVGAGVLAGLNALADAGLDRRALAALAAEIEGHPDNAAAGVLGGFCVPRTDPQTGALLDVIRFAVPAELVFTVASPAVEILTKESRGQLPAALPHADAVRSINSAAYLVAVFATREWDKLRHAVGDYTHEPYRLPKIPGGRAAIAAGVAAGAFTGWLSGSGSSVLCVSRRESSAAVRAAMAGAFARENLAGEVRALAADNDGLALE